MPRADHSAPARILRVLVALVLVASGVAAALAFSARRSATSGAAVCNNCHADVRNHAGGHRGQTCASCHSVSLREAVTLAWAGATHQRGTGGHTRADNGTCVQCHAGSAASWRALMATEGHARHARTQPETPCIRCHAGSLHDKPATNEGCMSCHRDVPLHSPPTDAASCTTCHRFSPGRSGREALTVALDPSHAAAVNPSRVHGAMDCRTCHNPHKAPGDPALAGGATCTSCHRGSIAEQVGSGPEGHRQCLGCHSVHADRRNAGIDCGRCHEPGHGWATASSALRPDGTQQLAAGWNARDGGLATAVPDASATDGGPHASWTHAGQCATCHRPHTWVAQGTDCRNCHSGQSTSLPPETQGHGVCLGCHNPHAPKPNAMACATCHAPISGAARGSRPPQHQNCLSCHQPHIAAKPDSTACNTCHARQREAVTRGPAQHQNCVSCHQPHGTQPGNSQVCTTCHGRERQSITTPGHASCAGCHRPHEFERARANQNCQTCHASTLAQAASHRGSCTQCHQPHAGVVAQGTDCNTCHSGRRTLGSQRAGSAHARCQSCHAPHRAGAEAPQRCASCHAEVVQTQRAWPFDSPHAGRCTQCHDVHGPNGTATCVSCHAAKNNREHTGTHAQCTQCHQPHRPRPPGGNPGWWTVCSNCHRAESAAASTAAPAHAACSNCHQRPGLQAPRCQDCHARQTGVLLHAASAHSNCMECHQRHGTPTPGRAQCVSHCHQDRLTHFPDAQRCQSCHPFVAPRS